MRDGQPALVSRQKNSLVLVRPASRQLQANGRPVFVVGINNFGKQPVEFRVAQVDAIQHVGGSDFGMQVVTFEMLVQEEKNRQVAAAILTGVAGAANAYSASRAGYGSYTTPGGRTGTFYSPTAAVIAQNNAAIQNEAMFAATVETGQRNMAALEQSVIKDNTLMPGEWYGGQLHIAPPTDQAGGQKKLYDRYYGRDRPACHRHFSGAGRRLMAWRGAGRAATSGSPRRISARPAPRRRAGSASRCCRRHHPRNRS